MVANGFLRIMIIQNACDIFTGKPRDTVDYNRADITEFVIVKELNIIEHTHTSSRRRHIDSCRRWSECRLLLL
jgi:hypothetical protein